METLDQTVSPNLCNLAKALRTGKKGIFDPTKFTKMYTDVYNATVRTGRKDPRDVQLFITRWCRKDLTENVLGELKSIPPGEDGDTKLFAAVATEYKSFQQVIKMLKYLFLQTDQAVASKLQVDPKIGNGIISGVGAASAGGVNKSSSSSSSNNSSSGNLSLSEQSALKAFYDTIFQPVEGRLRDSIFDQLDKIRDGNSNVDHSAIRSATMLFEKIAKVLCVTSADRESVYMHSFARPYFQRVESRVNQDYIIHGQGENFVEFLLARRELEGQLAKICLNTATSHQAIEVFDRCAVERRYLDILQHPRFGLEAYLDPDRFSPQAVCRLYKLFYKMTPTKAKILDDFAKAFGNSIIKDMHALKKQWEESTNHDSVVSLAGKVMQDVLALLRNKDLVVKNEFFGNVQLTRQRQLSFVQALNPTEAKFVTVPGMAKHPNQPPPSFVFAQLLAHYVDHTLRELASSSGSASTSIITSSGASGTSAGAAADESGWADPISQLFALISDKDLFAEYYRLQMSRRLLSSTYVDDNERAVLSRLQRQNGKVYTHKFEGMLNDVTQAAQLQDQFLNSYPGATGAAVGGCDFNTRILTAAFWPTIRRDENFILPESLVNCQDIFGRFYRKSHPTRQLRWQAERGWCVLAAAFPKGQKEITCSIYQAAVMIAIDENASSSSSGSSAISMQDLSRNTGLEVQDLKPLVASMLFAKGLNLVRRGNGVDAKAKLLDSDSFEMNPDYSMKIRKLKLPSAVSVKSAGNGGDADTVAEETIDASRAQMLDAAVVRIMKSRKELRIQEIVDLAIQSVQRFFVAQPRAIKKRVEVLIQKEFLERDETNPDIFRYLA